ncbi:MAG: ATP-binding cassette domain-containing protein [Candidatus Latescibacterota bacterium]
MIEVEGLTKYYGSHAAVDDVTFTAEKGEILGFLGPNGAGKTTTMRILTCYLPPTRGTARVAGHDILTDSVSVRKVIGYLPENVPLYGDLSVTSYLDFVGTLKGLPRVERASRAGLVMEQCGVTEVKNRPIGKLSRGYRQRVGLAQALLGDPEVLILDEPTVGLDPKQIVEIRNLIKSLAGERTIILSTHILPEVSLVCQRVVIINNGVLVTDDTPENLVGDLRSNSSVEVIARGDFERLSAALRELDVVADVRRTDTLSDQVVRVVVDPRGDVDIREAVAARLAAGGIGILGLRSQLPSLEDIFVQLVTEEPGGAAGEPPDDEGRRVN